MELWVPPPVHLLTSQQGYGEAWCQKSVLRDPELLKKTFQIFTLLLCK